MTDKSAEVLPAGALSKQHGKFRCRRGYDLYTTVYTPAVRRTTACLIFHHGLSDHAERHSAVLSHLCTSLGMAVYTYDAHGHGRSGPDGSLGRALIRSFSHMVDDLLDFTRQYVIPAEQKAAAAAAAAAAVTAAPAGAAQGPEAAAAAAAAEAGAGAREEEVEAVVEDVPSSSNASDSSDEGAPGQRRDAGGGGAPRVFLLGYSMGGLTCSLAVAATSSPSSSSSPSPAASSSPASASRASTSSSPDASSSDEASGSDAGLSSEGLPAATAAASNSSGLYAGLMLTSCLTDPLHGSSPLMRTIKLAYVTVLSRLAPTLPVFKRNPVESGIRDPAAVAEMARDKLWYRGKFKVSTIASLLWGCQRLRWSARRITLPLYVQHATVDVACSLPSMRAFLTRVGCTDVTLHVVEGAFHDLHHDPETPRLMGHMVEWLQGRV